MISGDRLGNDLEILELLRQSSFGNTYRARRLSMSTDVAVRVLDPRAISESSLARFLSDAERLAGMRHPNLREIYALGWQQRNPYVVMELLSEKSFSDVESELPGAGRLYLLLQASHGLAAMHGAGVVHRGFSPASICVNERSVKITEPGLSARLGQITHETQEMSGDRTSDYLSPEQIQGLEIGPASDVFAFGVVLYEVLTGKHPFYAEHPMALLNNVMNRLPEPPATRGRGKIAGLGSESADRLDALVLSCLNKVPDRRPPNMVAVSEELRLVEEHLLASGDMAATTIVRPTVRNPYGTRVMIRDREGFFGRKEESDRIFARLAAEPPESVALVGDQKIGKSSLLNYVYMRAKLHLPDPESLVVVFLDLRRDSAWTSGLFAEALLDAIALETEHRFANQDMGPDLGGVRKAVERLHKDGNRLILILDEFEAVTSNPNFPADFFAFLRSLAQHYNVAYVTSSVRDLDTLCHDRAICDSPFFNIFSRLRLGPFLPEETRSLIHTPSGKYGHPLDGHTEFIRNLAGDFPFFLQMACALVFHAVSETSVPVLELIGRRFRQDVEPHLRAMWEGLEGDERQLLKTIASGGRIEPSEQHLVDDLLTRGYLRRDPEDLRLFSAPFQEFVAQLVRREPEPVPASRTSETRQGKGRGRFVVVALAVAALAVSLAFVYMRRHADIETSDSSASDRNRGRAVPVTSTGAVAILPTYEKSYALVIGAGEYDHGWAKLPNVDSDVKAVGSALSKQGFQVETVMNPDAAHLRDAFQNFITRYGLNESDRLLFYFAGHGHTVRQSYGEEMGYIVPIDAPDPGQDYSGFLGKAISMDQIATFARSIQSRHALFVFDACFAGSIFTQSRSGPGYISFKLDSPVRQFITSGDANETVPDQSIFRREFVAGLEGEADMNHDGYITGSELGEFLLEKVTEYSQGAQHPRTGKLRDPNLDKGDFVFKLSESDSTSLKTQK